MHGWKGHACKLRKSDPLYPQRTKGYITSSGPMHLGPATFTIYSYKCEIPGSSAHTITHASSFALLMEPQIYLLAVFALLVKR